ncbi:MAG: tRNA (adenosine(37)-N6)-dimethylallyltransferase MiaA [Woeseiaceae bacterium]|nr:tRNA (adenosine(37)-N6)-dimethylallyltransferase MiaA [Woeseiaceae bacterium]
MTNAAVCLMGPTASGKTDIAVRLCKRFPFEIISVDSALVYRHMNIGTAKPDADMLKRAPHRLIDIRDPEEPYSAGNFARDASAAIADIHAAGRVPLLAGGTMMYFRALTRGIAKLPSADPSIRAEIDADARKHGWPAMHAKLCEVDPASAERINKNDSQRIQRALEVYRLSGKSLSDWHVAARSEQPSVAVRYTKIALIPEDRAMLHERIEQRLNMMINNGFVDEVKALYARPGLNPDAPSMRSVGYRQFWDHVNGQLSLSDARYRALVATRQLAKRQLTWLRSESAIFSVDPLEDDALSAISAHLAEHVF